MIFQNYQNCFFLNAIQVRAQEGIKLEILLDSPESLGKGKENKNESETNLKAEENSIFYRHSMRKKTKISGYPYLFESLACLEVFVDSLFIALVFLLARSFVRFHSHELCWVRVKLSNDAFDTGSDQGLCLKYRIVVLEMSRKGPNIYFIGRPVK